MKAYGYQKNNDNLLELEEVSFECDIKEIDEIIKFFQYVKKEHSKTRLEAEFYHSHLRDWKESWTNESSDIIVVTNFSSSFK